ncbi:probable LRR receptor-like serine/threonine-protein kinase RFK1 isoform X2 [Syzygium oleosum]|uniref:probable LRR receptor-like serine/threonine-protein kinase RFK1 isoform X2 n=1 Tax=Syzygium oleosum TaxID=219896 RepID=UPI0024BB65AE|nr:probable LRR receptor-like serine/threonine-protein kinase RFK1 isoform X2 [Syzygium oleosum]
MVAKNSFTLLIFALSCFGVLRLAEPKVSPQEVDALQQIAAKMGAKYWEFDGNSCAVVKVGVTTEIPEGAESTIACECNIPNDTLCHVISIVLKGYSLPGSLPPEVAKLPHLREIDFAYNYLYGTIPQEWASMQLTSISLLVNRLSGEIPKTLANITSLTYLMLSSNQLTGNLPTTFAGLINLTDFRISDNNFSGRIPEFIQNWKQLNRLEMIASGLEGPIPTGVSLLNDMVSLRISDIIGPRLLFPNLSNMTGLVTLVLRNCNISGEIPSYIWNFKELEVVDLSFNKLVGEIPATITAKSARFIFLTGNILSGQVPDSILKDGTSVDLSYNNFSWQSSEQRACQGNLDLNLNLFKSSSQENNLSRAVPCLDNFRCSRYSSCRYVNCGGQDANIKENKQTVLYEGDGEVEGGTALYFFDRVWNWGFSSTGDFMDDNDFQNKLYTVTSSDANMDVLDKTARISPISLTYFFYCLRNGQYTVHLRFAEIQFTTDNAFNSLGKRIFHIYVQDKLVRKDFNIKDEAGGVEKPALEIFTVNVTNNMLEVRFYWAGKGTTRIPRRSVYGPLVSAISVVSDFEACASRTKRRINSIFIGVGVLCFVFFVLCILWWKGYLTGKRERRKSADDRKGLDLQTRTYSLQQIKAATNDFDPAFKIGEGGFGPVYKGHLPDGAVVAVKQLSSRSKQGNREFLNEIGMISCLQHPNLVKLHGCCIEGDQLLLVYEYMEKNSLSRVMFGPQNYRLQLDWPTRLKICIGVAKGLAFLHEESRLRIIHRDIKATNVLLDQDLNPKISDFGLARLDEEEKTHISTKVAGTVGYMAPEYALWGYLTYKADVYSFGVLVLEIVSGQSNNSFVPSDECLCLLDWACQLQQSGNLMELVDEKLKPEIDRGEAEMVIKVVLLCTNASPSLRPTMSEVVNMLEGRATVSDPIPEPGKYSEDLRFKAMRDIRRHTQGRSMSGNQSGNMTSGNVTAVHTFGSSSVSTHNEFVEIKPESRPYLA